jgi:hypothetical protein
VSEYGAGAATSTAPIQLTETALPTIDDSAIQTWLAGKLNGNDPAWPAADENTVYALFYPTGTTITLGGGGAPPPTDGGVEGGPTEGGGGGGGFGAETSCTDFGGYHDNITLDATHGSIYVSYAVVPRCATFGPLTGIDVITGAGSHELIEATTDPYPTSEPAYLSVDSAHLYWSSVLGGGEVCDMCAQFPTSFTKFSELAYTVQRCWSNKAETAGHDPCVTELPGEVYFNSAPVFSSVPATIEGMTTNVEGVTIAVGASQTLTVDLFSEGPTAGPWSLSASDLAELEGQAADLSFSFDKTSGQNGDKVQMTIKVLTAGRRNHEEFILYSKLGTQENSWIGFVNN